LLDLPPVEVKIPIADLTYDKWEAVMESLPLGVKLILFTVLIVVGAWTALKALS